MTTPLTKIIGLTFVVQLAIFAIGFLNNVLLSRWLGPAALGMVVLLFQIAELIYKFTNFGMESSVLYHVSSRRFPLQRIFGTAFSLALIFILFAAVGTLVVFHTQLITLIFKKPEVDAVISKAGWCVLLIAGLLVYEYGSKITLGLQKYITYNKMSLVRPLLLLVFLSLTQMIWKLNITNAILVYGISWFIPGILLWKNTLPFKPSCDPGLARSFFSYGWKIMGANIFTFLSYRVDIFFIGYFWSPEMVGLYYVSLMIGERLHYLTQPTSTILFPATASSAEQQNKTPVLARINFSVILLGAVVVALSAHWFIPLIFSSEFEASVTPLLILLPGIVALTLPKILSADLSGRGIPQISMYISILIFILKVVLNMVTIPRMGISGAALSSSIAYIFATILIGWTFKRITGTPIHKLFLIRWGDFKNIRNI
ncbi:MAG: hypothetical protein Kow0042_10100 [Calditrichia bacterium]